MIAVTVLVTTVLGVIALWQHKKPKLDRMLVGGTGLVLVIGIMAAYYIECHLILTSIQELQPSSIDVWAFDEEANAAELILTEEMQKEVLDKVTTLKPEKGKVVGEEGNRGLENTITIHVWYPERYHHSYIINVTITEDNIIYNRYNSPVKDPVAKDNGLRELIDEISENPMNKKNHRHKPVVFSAVKIKRYIRSQPEVLYYHR